MHLDNSTICAIATPPGNGAIALLRVSGDKAFNICDKLVIFKRKSKKINYQSTQTIFYCNILDKDIIIDDVLISIFKKPHSYTGEDVVEISCHGSIYIQQKILELLIKNGARFAQPGEFTFRAFMNGKLDLSQAEAVADLIASQNQASHHVAMNQMRGGFSHMLEGLRKQLLEFTSLIELELDFSEEDVEFADREKMLDLIYEIISTCEKLAQSFKLGNAIKNGIPVAIVGKPNTGKSTLLNTLLNEDKAIVSEIPGTTRDSIEDTINIKGIRVRFIDTAGIRDTDDIIENLGIEKTFEKIKNAVVILLVIDDTGNINDIHEQLKKIHISTEQSLAIVLNKIDRIGVKELKDKLMLMSDLPFETIAIAAKFKRNIESIEQLILNAVNYGSISEDDVIITNVRHFEALEKTIFSGNNVIGDLNNNISPDLISEDIREMLHHIGEITGEVTTDEILGNIFKNFCIGK